MTRDARFKQRVRERMRRTGENYLAALHAIRPQRTRPQTSYSAWIEMLVDPERRRDAWRRLAALGDDERRAVAMRAIIHESPHVRRPGCQLLDHLTLTDEGIAALVARLDDPHAEVRQAALHTLTCVRCKPDGCAFDIRAVLERMRSDPSAEVRRAVIHGFANLESEEAVAALRDAARSDRSIRVRSMAEMHLRGFDHDAAAREAWRAQPEDIRVRLAKHAGKYVAIAGGRIVGANRSASRVHKEVQRTGVQGAVVCLVDENPQGASSRNTADF